MSRKEGQRGCEARRRRTAAKLNGTSLPKKKDSIQVAFTASEPTHRLAEAKGTKSSPR